MTWLPADDGDPEQPDAVCAVPKCKRLRSGAWTTCRQHGEDVGNFLAAIPDNVLDRLTAMPVSATPDDSGISGGGLKSHRSPATLDVITIRDPRSKERDPVDPDGNNTRSPLEVLHAYAETVREARCLYVFGTRVMQRLAGRPGPVCETECRHESCYRMVWWLDAPWRPTVASERKLLRDHLDWCLRQDFAADMWRELRELDRTLAMVLVERDGEERPTAQGVHGGCGGRLWYAPAADGGKARGWCDDCDRTWTGLQLAAMAREKAA